MLPDQDSYNCDYCYKNLKRNIRSDDRDRAEQERPFNGAQIPGEREWGVSTETLDNIVAMSDYHETTPYNDQVLFV